VLIDLSLRAFGIFLLIGAGVIGLIASVHFRYLKDLWYEPSEDLIGRIVQTLISGFFLTGYIAGVVIAVKNGTAMIIYGAK
jgi:hypothetical protein